MARMHSRKHGKAGSKKPDKRKQSWINYDAKEIEQLVLKLAKQGSNSSRIGLILRDSYGIPDVKSLTNKKIGKILEENQLKSKLPEDITALVRKIIVIIKHLENNKQDMPAKRGLILTESKIRRLAKYYIREGVLDKKWKYSRDNVKLLVG